MPKWGWAPLLTALITIPALFVGFSHDDLVHRLVLEQRLSGVGAGWLGLYDFTPPSSPSTTLVQQGFLPWFTDPELSLRFLRPISSATLALDHVLFGRRAFPAHLHSLLWMVLLAFIAAKLYERWFSARAAFISGLVFALSGVHGVPTVWLAARSTLITAVLGCLALWVWARFREERWQAGFWLGPSLLALGLLAGESGLVGVLLLTSYEVGTRGLRRGLLGAVPHLLVGCSYLAMYAALGYGSRGSGFYVSPFESPMRYLARAVTSVPALCTELLLAVPSAISHFVNGAELAFVILGLGALLGYAALLNALRSQLGEGERRALAWLSFASFVSLFALVGAPVTGRVLPLPMLGAAAVIGNALAALRARPGRGWLLPLGLLLLLHFGLSPLLRVGSALQFVQFAEAQRRLAVDADVDRCRSRGSIYLLNASDPILSLAAASALMFYAPEKAGADHFRMLSMAPQRHRLHRTETHAFELEVLDLPRRSNAFEGLYRSPEHPLREGQRIRAGELEVTVLEAEAGVFTRARFDRGRELEAANVCLMVWRHQRLEHLPLPALGQSVTFGYEPGPMGM